MLRRCEPVAIPRHAEACYGQAFEVGEARMALRWAALMQPHFYRLKLVQCDRHADEVLEISLRAHRKPLMRIVRHDDLYASTNCAGETAMFTSLGDALCAVTPLSSQEQKFLHDGHVRLITRARAALKHLFA